MPQKTKEKSSTSPRVWTVLGIVLCVILIPILILNITLIVRSYTNADEVPGIGGYSPLIVLTGSMDADTEERIREGDLIIVKKIDGSDVKVGDVIAFFDPSSEKNSLLTHRVVEVFEENGTLFFRTKGDANISVDGKPVSADKLVGIYTGTRIPGAGSVALFMQSTAGLITCVVVPLVLLIGWDIFRRRRYEKKTQQDTDALLAELESLKAAKAAEQNVAAEVEAPKEAPNAFVEIPEPDAAPARPKPMRARRTTEPAAKPKASAEPSDEATTDDTAQKEKDATE